MINIFVLVTILGHLPVILSAKSKGSENMEQILIVEDDSFLNKMLDYNLTADGYGVTSALNARTAADAIRQREFDLVLLDINLPDGNGFELCKLIKPQIQRFQQFPVICPLQGGDAPLHHILTSFAFCR